MSSSSENPAAQPEMPENPPSPEAQAAFVRCYLELRDKPENEQISLLEKGVREAVKKDMKYSTGKINPQFAPNKSGTLYGAEFDEYVNEVLVRFCSGKYGKVEEEEEKQEDEKGGKDKKSKSQEEYEKFIDNLQKEFEKCFREYQKMREEFLDSVFKEWDTETADMTDDELDVYLEKQFDARVKEFEQKRATFEERYPGYPKLKTLLRRFAQNTMYSWRKKQEVASRNVSLDAESEGQGKLDIGDGAVNGINAEDELAMQELLERIRNTLDDRGRQILDLKMSGYSQNDIATTLNISDAAVSKRLKKIKAIITAIYHES